MAHSLSRPLGTPPQASTSVRHDPVNCPDIDPVRHDLVNCPATTVRHDPVNCPDIDSGQLLQRNHAAFDNLIFEPISTIHMINDLRSENLFEMHFKTEANKECGGDMNYFVTSNTDSWCVDPVFAVFLVDGAWSKETEQATVAWVAVNRNGWKVASRAFSFQAHS
ncbi:hypothetical protein HYC85_023196 [Camellia sinensis]|uniref:Uncharacterized protein n=1 Tax=Camellia sinensis TaxID=4442 RepID=A0A7J7GEI1_CAMSI|nr:hypothetical protein HYC85_023196 [Camellia sinensis]